MTLRMPQNNRELRLFVEDARENGKLTFNGSVLQLTLGKYQRLNFYTQALDQTGPHNHALGFTSWVISGMFVNAIYQRISDGPYRRFTVDRKAGISTFNRTDETYGMEFLSADLLQGGVVYRMEAEPIHVITIIEPSITYVERDREAPGVQDTYFNEDEVEVPVVAPVSEAEAKDFLADSWALIDKMLTDAKVL